MKICPKCKKTTYYNVEECIFCGSKYKESNSKKLKVKEITKVFIPSPGHEDVPYFNLILEDKNNNFYIKKSKKKYNIGDSF